MLQAAVLVNKDGEPQLAKNIFITRSGKTVVVNEFIHPDCGDLIDSITGEVNTQGVPKGWKKTGGYPVILTKAVECAQCRVMMKPGMKAHWYPSRDVYFGIDCHPVPLIVEQNRARMQRLQERYEQDEMSMYRRLKAKYGDNNPDDVPF